MRKLIILEFMSLDGVIQAPGGPEEDTSEGFEFGGWMAPFFDDSSGEEMLKQMKAPFDLLLGRKTYDIWVNYWPKHADAWPGVNEAKKYVASNTLKTSTWENTVFLEGDIVSKIKELKKEDGPDIQVYGSANLVQTLLKNDLVDELWLKIFPLTLGKGKRLFTNGAIPKTFELTHSKVTEKGVIFANFKRAGEVTTGSME